MQSDHFIPLAERMRPETLEQYLGQKHLIGKDAPLYKAIGAGLLPSIILWGPPGVGKTTLAQILAQKLNRPFYTLSAINSGVKDIREILERVKNQGLFGGNHAILFIDEIHRFSKSQQDSLLGAVEKGTITLIGATTENPSFEVISALLSRCQVHVLKSHSAIELSNLLDEAISRDEILKRKNLKINEKEALIHISGGDARKLLNSLEALSNVVENGSIITNDLVEKNLNHIVNYDKKGDNHYDIASALIKSIRGSDPNAAIYWLARMIAGGEDPKFIARRLIISAAEDIGLANPNALILANATFEAVAKIGMPESRIILSQCTIYLATSAKSNSAYSAINIAQETVKSTGNLPVPLHLRNAPTQLMSDLGYGKNYHYSHAAPEIEQEFFPEKIVKFKIFDPGQNKKETEIRKFLQQINNNKYLY